MDAPMNAPTLYNDRQVSRHIAHPIAFAPQRGGGFYGRTAAGVAVFVTKARRRPQGAKRTQLVWIVLVFDAGTWHEMKAAVFTCAAAAKRYGQGASATLAPIVTTYTVVDGVAA